MEFLIEYGLFLAKAVTIVVALMFVIGALIPMAKSGQQGQEQGTLHVTRLNDRYKLMKQAITDVVLEGKAKKNAKKEVKQVEKEHKKKLESEEESPARLYVVNFKGDIQAKAVMSLRQEISAILTMVRSEDEVLAVIESPGGAVHGYGLAASQLDRIRQKGIPLTAAVDKVAASGGYMMACVAHKIVAAPFAILGSIGVVGQMPNFNRFLKKHDVDYEIHTAGEYKRTLTMLGENTDEDRKKFSEDLEEIHVLFKEFVSEHRKEVNIEEVATGEIWLGKQALAKNLVDELATSDEYILDRVETMDILEVRFEPKKSIQEKLGRQAESTVDNLLVRWWQRLRENRFIS